MGTLVVVEGDTLVVKEGGYPGRDRGWVPWWMGGASPEERSPQMAQSRFWASMGPGLWGDSFTPNGGFTSSELLTA